MTHDHDVCICDHVRVIHRPTCDGKYAGGGFKPGDDKWIKDRNDPERHCNCQTFILEEEYKEPPVCPICGHELEDD